MQVGAIPIQVFTLSMKSIRQVVAGVRACPALSKSQRCKSAVYVIICRRCFFWLRGSYRAAFVFAFLLSDGVFVGEVLLGKHEICVGFANGCRVKRVRIAFAFPSIG